MESVNKKPSTSEEVEHVVFQSHKRKVKSGNKIEKRKDRHETENLIDMKRVRYEVIKFGMAGFEPQKYQEAKVAVAVKLGAKPPKNAYINYKQLKEQKKQEKESEVTFGSHNNNKKTKARNPTQKERRKTNILDPYGRAGQVTFKRKKQRRH